MKDFEGFEEELTKMGRIFRVWAFKAAKNISESMKDIIHLNRSRDPKWAEHFNVLNFPEESIKMLESPKKGSNRKKKKKR